MSSGENETVNGTEEKDITYNEEEESEEEDKITTITIPSQPEPLPTPADELEYQLAAEKQEQYKIQSGHYYTDQTDGTCYEWDEEKRAWFPRVTEDFLAAYQMSYGVGTAPSAAPVAPAPVPAAPTQPDTPNPEPKTKKQKKDPEWFEIDADKNTWVYVAGLPLTMTFDDFAELMGKYGLIMQYPDSDQKKIKLYTDSEGNFKGDAKCCYYKKESLPLAIQMLDGTRLPGSNKKVRVQQATFELKGEYNPKLKPKKKKPNNKKKKGKDKHENLLDWRDRAGGTDLRPKHAKIMIMKHCFDPKEFLEDATQILEIRDDIREECAKIGEVKKVLIFDRHPDGIVSVKFNTHEASGDAVKAFDKRWFGGMQLEAFLWDGVTDYAIEETIKEREHRLANWHKFISGDEPGETNNKASASPQIPAEQTAEIPTK